MEMESNNSGVIRFIFNGALMSYEDKRLRMVPGQYNSAPTLEEGILMLISSPWWDEMIRDYQEFERRNPCSITMTEGRMTGRRDYWLMENRGRIYGMPEYSKSHHTLHVSMVGKLNNGLNVFGPDLILTLIDRPELKKIVEDTLEMVRKDPYAKMGYKELPLIQAKYKPGKPQAAETWEDTTSQEDNE